MKIMLRNINVEACIGKKVTGEIQKLKGKAVRRAENCVLQTRQAVRIESLDFMFSCLERGKNRPFRKNKEDSYLVDPEWQGVEK